MNRMLPFYCRLRVQNDSSRAFVDTADSMEYRLVDLSHFFKHGPVV